MFFIVGQQFLILFAKQSGFDLSNIPIFIILFTFIQTVTIYYGGVLIDRVGSYKMLMASFIFGILSILSINFNLWLSFVFLGLFTVLSLNSIRSYISVNAKSKGFMFGILYGGVAIVSSISSLNIGYLWQYLGFETMLVFTLIGMITLFIFSILKNMHSSL